MATPTDAHAARTAIAMGYQRMRAERNADQIFSVMNPLKHGNEEACLGLIRDDKELQRPWWVGVDVGCATSNMVRHDALWVKEGISGISEAKEALRKACEVVVYSGELYPGLANADMKRRDQEGIAANDLKEDDFYGHTLPAMIVDEVADDTPTFPARAMAAMSDAPPNRWSHCLGMPPKIY